MKRIKLMRVTPSLIAILVAMGLTVNEAMAQAPEESST